MKKNKITFMTVVKNLDAVITCVTLSICVIMVNVNVFTRYLLKKPVVGAEENVTSLFVWTVFIGSAYAHRKHSHLGVDIVVNMLPGKSKDVVANIVFILELVILIMVTVISAQYVYHLIYNAAGKYKPTVSDVLRIPKWYTAIAVPIGFGLSVIYSIVDLLTNKLHILKKPEDGAAEHDPGQGGGAV